MRRNSIYHLLQHSEFSIQHCQRGASRGLRRVFLAPALGFRARLALYQDFHFESAAMRGADLVRQLMLFARSEAKETPFRAVDLGAVIADTVSLKRISPTTVERTDKKGGKVVQTLTRVISADGKTLTITTKGTNAQGQPVNNVAIYEKQ